MKKLLTIILLGFTVQSFAQYCLTGGPTSNADSDLGAITLNGQTMNINIASSCPGTIGLEDLTGSQTADLIANSNYTLSVDFNSCGGFYNNSGEVWIDYDLNNAFDPGESIGTWTGTPPSGVQSYNFTIPTWVCNGNTRIRVSQEEGGTNPLDPCASYTWGAMIDATIILSGGTCQIAGCTDSTAVNYNPIAVIDDGSCMPIDGINCDTPNVITSLPFNQIGLNTALYGNHYSSANACGSTFMDGNDYVFEYTATSTECINVVLSNTSFQTGLFLLDGCPNLAANCLAQGNGTNASVSATINAGTYYIVVSSDPSFGGPQSVNFDINITTAGAGAAGSTCGNPVVVTSGYSQAGLSTSCFGNDYSSTDACGSINMNGDDFIFEYIPNSDTCVTITLANATFSTGLFLVKNCPDASFSTCISADIGGSATIIGANVEKDSVYYIVVSTDGFPTSTPFDITVQELSCPIPTIQDCDGATIICQDYFEPNTFSLDGNIHDEVPNSSCLGSGEKNSVWYQFTSHSTGFLGFTIFPNTPTDDYDWAVYDITNNGCGGVPSGLSPEVSCDYAPNVCPPPNGDGSTGPNGDLSGPCAGQNQPLIPVDSGDTYVIVVSQYTDLSQDGFTISFDTNGVISANTIDAVDETVNCGDVLVLDANFNGPIEDTLIYAWSPAIKLNDSTLAEPTTVPLDSNINYIVKVRNGLCELIDTVNVEVTYADFTTLQDTSLCFGIDYTIVPEFEDDIDVANLTFNWTPNSNISNINDSTPTITTFDTITYFVEIVNGICVEYDSVNIYVTDSLASVPSFFINDNFESGGVAEVEFYNASVGTSINYLWDFADDNISEEFEPLHIYVDEGTYPVMLKVTDTLGCIDSVIINVAIPLLELPNIFTPNGDGFNDVFSIDRLRPQSNLKIYNRWGGLVFESLGYDNLWNGGELSDGSYYAELSYQRKGEITIYKGWFEIRR